MNPETQLIVLKTISCRHISPSAFAGRDNNREYTLANPKVVLTFAIGFVEGEFE